MLVMGSERNWGGLLSKARNVTADNTRDRSHQKREEQTRKWCEDESFARWLQKES